MSLSWCPRDLREAAQREQHATARYRATMDHVADTVGASLGDLQVQGTLQKPFGMQPLLAAIARGLARRR